MSQYARKTPGSKKLFERARKSIPGGVNYGIRYFRPYPLFVSRAKGCYVQDVDGNEYLDFWIGHFALIMGHAYPKVVRAATDQIGKGSHFGFEHEWEILLAEQIRKMMPSIQLVRFTNSGTEANMYAARVARAYTKRQKIAKFEGGWHGGFDSLHKAVSYPFSAASSAGLPKETETETVVLPYNDLEGASGKIRRERPAAVVLDAIPGAGGFIPAEKEFVKGIREACEQAGSLMVMDEVISGFRTAPGGVQSLYRVKPDITILGKIVGGGMFPAGAFGGRSDIMDMIDQLKHKEARSRSFHGGTYSGNPLVTRAGYTLLKELESGSVQRRLDGLAARMRKGLEEVFESNHLSACITGLSSVMCIHFMEGVPRSPKEAYEKNDRKSLEALFYYMLANGLIYMSPDQAHIGLSAAHTREHVNRFVELVDEFAKKRK
jgi:glutamate-1-semialdehyde 2,1-aminomutase